MLSSCSKNESSFILILVGGVVNRGSVPVLGIIPGKTSGSAGTSAWKMPSQTLKLQANLPAPPELPPEKQPKNAQTPGKTSGAAWSSAWKTAPKCPNSGQNIRRRLNFRLKNSPKMPKLQAKLQAPPGVPPGKQRQNAPIPGKTSGAARCSAWDSD